MECVSEEAVRKLHDVGLVYTGDLFPVICQSETKGKFGDAFRLCPGDDFEGLDHARDGLVLEARVFSLGVFSDDAEIYVVVSSLVARDILNKDNRRVDIKLLP